MTPPNVAIYEFIRRGFDFKGRSSRAEFWWPIAFFLFCYFIGVSLFMAAGGEAWAEIAVEQLTAPQDERDFSSLPRLTRGQLFVLIFVLVIRVLTFIPEIAVSVRRLHDLGQTGWLHLVFLIAGFGIPVIPGLLELVWFAFKGQTGANKYGPDPLA